MVVDTEENFEITKGLGFTLFGVGPRYKRRAQRMQPADRVLFYVNTLRKWTATATIKSNSFEDHAPVWKPDDRSDFMFRVQLAPEVVVEEEDYIDALLLAPSLEYVKRWIPEDWPLAFHDRLHLLPQRDFRLIEGEMRRNLSRRRGRAREDAPDRSDEQPEEQVQEHAAASPWQTEQAPNNGGPPQPDESLP